MSVSAENAQTITPSSTRGHYHVFCIRWAIVSILSLVNGTSAYLWISFAPVADHFMAFYSTNETILNWTQLIFPITTVVFGLPATLMVDWLGVRFVILFSAAANLTCGLLRVLSSLPVVNRGLALVIVGQLIASLSQPLCMFTPAKLALEWFPENQRTIANTIGSLGNSVGVLLGSAFAPLIVQKPSQIPLFNYISLGVVCFGFIVSCVIVRRGKPQVPPSVAAAVMDQMHKRQISSKNCSYIIWRLRQFASQCIAPFRSVGFCLLAFAFGFALAYFTALSTLFQQILCTKGYSNEFAGLCGSLMIAAGLVASVFSALYADRTGLLKEAVQVCYALATLGAAGFSITLWYPEQQIGILLCVSWLGAWGFAQYSLALELAAEATFPVPEAITSGLMVIISQLLSVALVSFMQFLAPYASSNAQFTPACGPAATPQDYGIPNLSLCGLIVIISIVQLFCLRLSYKRRDASQACSSTVNLDRNTILPIEPDVDMLQGDAICISTETMVVT